MHKVLLISDIHICAPGKTIIDLNPSAQLQMVLDAALTDHPDAKALIVMGDLTHHGEIEEFAEVKRILDRAPIPVTPMLGNHDKRDAYLSVFPDAPRMNGDFVQSYQDIGHCRVITLDSLDGPPYPPDHHSGHICKDRLRFLQSALETRGGRYALVCIHHPPFETGILGMDLIKLENGAELLDVLAKAGRVHLACGHIHRTISGNTNGVGWSMIKSTCHQGVLDFTDPNAHLSSNDPAGYGLALLSDDGVVIHHINVGLTGVKTYGGYSSAPSDKA